MYCNMIVSDQLLEIITGCCWRPTDVQEPAGNEGMDTE